MGASNEYPQNLLLERNKQNYLLIITKYPLKLGYSIPLPTKDQRNGNRLFYQTQRSFHVVTEWFRGLSGRSRTSQH